MARPGSAAADADICRRTPGAQKRILERLAVKLCAAVSPRELFGFDEITIHRIHPAITDGPDLAATTLGEALGLDLDKGADREAAGGLFCSTCWVASTWKV